MTLWQKIKAWFKSAKKPAEIAASIEPRENKQGQPVTSQPPTSAERQKSASVHFDRWKYPGISRYLPDPDMGAEFSTAGSLPKAIVLHHTCSYNLDSTIEWFKAEGVDVHFLIGHDGEVVQMVPCNRKAAHAGKSSWRDMSGLNDWAIGIEIVNIGPLEKRGGKFFDCYGREWRGQVRERVAEGRRYWAPFTAEQEKQALELCAWACKQYGIEVANVAAHSEVSPGRKNDPGGSLSLTMPEFRAALAQKLSEPRLA